MLKSNKELLALVCCLLLVVAFAFPVVAQTSSTSSNPQTQSNQTQGTQTPSTQSPSTDQTNPSPTNPYSDQYNSQQK